MILCITEMAYFRNMPKKIVQLQTPHAMPFLKWAGGKSQLLEKFEALYPPQLKNNAIAHYYEPFLGSGAVFFDIARQFTIKKAYLYDINEELVLTYKVVQKNAAELIDYLYRYQKKYNRLDTKQRSDFFYKQRFDYNSKKESTDFNNYSEQWIARAAQTIFLNRTCFNGLYRVNSTGAFNTPAGRYENPAICNEENLLAASKVLSIATIKKADFKQVKKDLKPNSFIYLDPPYRPISKTASFKAYSKHNFDDAAQKELAALFTYLHEKDLFVMLSNSDPKNSNPSDNFFDELYKEYNIQRVPAKRLINANAAKRGKINEIVITNY